MRIKPIDYECGECGEPQSAHSDTHDSAIIDHEYILGCYCAESGRCEVCETQLSTTLTISETQLRKDKSKARPLRGVGSAI